MLNESDKEAIFHYLSDTGIIVVGGIAVELNTGIARPKSDIDIIIDKNNNDTKNLIRTLPYQLGMNVDKYEIDSICGCLNLKETKIKEKSIQRIENKYGELQILGPEALIVTKLASLSVSGENYQSSRFGVKILRDKDLEDIINLENINHDSSLVIELLSQIKTLTNDLYDINRFYRESIGIIKNTNLPESIRRNAYGIAKLSNIFESENTFKDIINSNSNSNTLELAHKLDSLTILQELTPKYEVTNPLLKF